MPIDTDHELNISKLLCKDAFENTVFYLLIPASEVSVFCANNIYGTMGPSSSIPVAYYFVGDGYKVDIEIKNIVDDVAETVTNHGINIKSLSADTDFNPILLESDIHGMGNKVIGVKNELIVKWRKSGKSALKYFLEEYITYYDTN